MNDIFCPECLLPLDECECEQEDDDQEEKREVRATCDACECELFEDDTYWGDNHIGTYCKDCAEELIAELWGIIY